MALEIEEIQIHKSDFSRLPNGSRIANILRTASDAAVIVMLGIVIVVAAGRWRGNASHSAGGLIAETDLRGKSAELGGARLERTVNVVMALSTQCPYCERNVDLYRSLAAQRNAGQMSLIAVFPQSSREARRYLDDRGVAVDEVVGGGAANLPVRATPALLLVDRGGKILRGWIGALDDDRQRAVFDALGEVCPRCLAGTPAPVAPGDRNAMRPTKGKE